MHGRLAVDAVDTADAGGRPAHHPVAHAAAAPEWRRRCMDLLRLVLRYVGNGVAQVLRVMVRTNLGEPRDAGVVVSDKLLQARDGAGLVVDELHMKSGEERHDAGVVVNRDMAKESKRRNVVANMNIDTRTAARRNQAWIYQNFSPRDIPFMVRFLHHRMNLQQSVHCSLNLWKCLNSEDCFFFNHCLKLY